MNDMGAFLKNMFQPRKQKGTHVLLPDEHPIRGADTIEQETITTKYC